MRKQLCYAVVTVMQLNDNWGQEPVSLSIQRLVYIFCVPFLLLRIFGHGDKDISAGDGLASIRNIKAARKKMHQYLRNSCKNAHLILISFYAVTDIKR